MLSVGDLNILINELGEEIKCKLMKFAYDIKFEIRVNAIERREIQRVIEIRNMSRK